MKFVCERCHTKYSIADEKVRGKVLKVRCKSCENVITVRETGATIDDAGSGIPKEAPVTRSGTLDARTGDSSAVSVGPAGRRVDPEPARRSSPAMTAEGEKEDTQSSAGPPLPRKRNGGAPAAAPHAAAKPAFGLEDMFEGDGGPGLNAAATASSHALPAAAASSSALPVAVAASVSVPVAAPGRAGGRPVRLIFGAVALAVLE